MARDTNGTMSLASGNPVTSGTSITATWANTTLSDLANEVTNSLDRSGRGGMLAAFKALDGSLSAPGLAWTNEPTTGFFRSTTNDMQATVGGTPVMRWLATGTKTWDAANAAWGVIATTDTAQTVSALKTFSAGLTVSSGTTSLQAATATSLSVGGSAVVTAAGVGTTVPSPTGTGASGTWGINITGSAASATTASSATTATSATSASSAAAVSITNDTSSSATHYPLLSTSSSGTGSAKTSSTRLYFVPSSGNLTAAGNVTAYSDARVKSNVERIKAALDKVLTLKGVTFTRTDIDGHPRQTGLIAQDVQRVLPEAVAVNPDGILSLAYGNLAGLLVEAVKELEGRVRELEMA